MIKNAVMHIGDQKKFRYERKFLISELNAHEIESIVKLNPSMFSEIFYQRSINNAYLDSHSMSNYFENESGINQRFKVRIRWYGKMFGLIEKPILELKIRHNELGRKLLYPLKPFILDKNFSIKSLQKVFLDSNLPLLLIDYLKTLHFALLNRYKRKYFQSSEKNYRITIDSDIHFYKINNLRNSFVEIVKDKNNLVLELKYQQEHDTLAKEITNHFPFRLTKNSKYAAGINKLNIW